MHENVIKLIITPLSQLKQNDQLLWRHGVYISVFIATSSSNMKETDMKD